MNIHIDLGRIAQVADELDAMIGDEDERLFHDMLLGETNVDHVVTRIHEQVARDNEMLLGIKARAETLKERRDRIERRIESGRVLIGKVLRTAHLLKLELPEVTYTVRDGKSGLQVVDPAAVPVELCRQKVEPDKAKINEAFADAATLPNWLVRVPARDVVQARTK